MFFVCLFFFISEGKLVCICLKRRGTCFGKTFSWIFVLMLDSLSSSGEKLEPFSSVPLSGKAKPITRIIVQGLEWLLSARSYKQKWIFTRNLFQTNVAVYSLIECLEITSNFFLTHNRGLACQPCCNSRQSYKQLHLFKNIIGRRGKKNPFTIFLLPWNGCYLCISLTNPFTIIRARVLMKASLSLTILIKAVGKSLMWCNFQLIF